MKSIFKKDWFFPLLALLLIMDFTLTKLIGSLNISWIQKLNSFNSIGSIALPIFITLPEMRNVKIWKHITLYLIFVSLVVYSKKYMGASIATYTSDYFQVFVVLAGIEMYYVKESEGKKGFISYLKYIGLTFLLSALVLVILNYI